MLRLTCHITIGTLVFNYVSNVSIETSWKMLTDTCKITLPRNILSRSGMPLFGKIKTGDRVTVLLGYDDQLKEEFRGYVSNVSPTVPLTIDCEDEMYVLKKQKFSFAEKNGNLQKILKQIYTGSVDAFDADLGNFRADATGVQIFDKIKSSYGLNTFFRGETLVCGKPYENPKRQLRNFHYEKNVITPNLTYVRKEDIKLKVTAISILPNNTKIEVELGDKDGDERTLNYYNVTSAARLKELATQELDKLKYSGYRGTLLTFGAPSVQHGDIVAIRGDRYRDNTGSYYVDKVVKNFGNNGYRQNIELGPLAQLN